MGWCAVGVLNTDNMSVLGLTLDYGPFGFMDRYHADHACNTSDTEGRYRFSQQPEMCNWNCQQLADVLRYAVPRAELKLVRLCNCLLLVAAKYRLC
jgi:uncharacterized protein YdiU (UPF0061 family)